MSFFHMSSQATVEHIYMFRIDMRNCYLAKDTVL